MMMILNVKLEICLYEQNVLLRRFGKCSRELKLRLFKSYCMGFYDIALWKHYNAGTINRLKSAYIKCIKTFFGFSRRHSVTQMLQELHIVHCVLIPYYSIVVWNLSLCGIVAIIILLDFWAV